MGALLYGISAQFKSTDQPPLEYRTWYAAIRHLMQSRKIRTRLDNEP